MNYFLVNELKHVQVKKISENIIFLWFNFHKELNNTNSYLMLTNGISLLNKLIKNKFWRNKFSLLGFTMH